MLQRPGLSVPIVTAHLVAALVMLGSSGAVTATEECLERPNAPAPAGRQWYFSSDPANYRKCYHLGPSNKKPAATAPTDASQEPAPNPTFSSLWGSLVSGLKGANSADAKQDAPEGERRAAQAKSATGAPAPKPPNQPRVAQADHRNAVPLDPAQREALFQSFLRWRQQQQQQQQNAARN
jgi:hypothetical protein